MEYIKLSDCASFRESRTNNITLENYITTENMLPNKGGITKIDSLPSVKAASKYEIGDILLSNIRPYFCKIWHANRVGSCSNDVLVVQVNENHSSKFIYYVLSDKNFFNYSTVTSKGTKMPRGTPKAIMKYLVPAISIESENIIADILSKYDELMEVNNQRIKKLEQTAEELYKEWFVRFRFPNYQNTEFENGIPKGWKISKTKELVKRLPFGTLYKTEDTETEGKIIVIDQSQDEYVGFHNNEPSHIATAENPIILFGDHSCKFQLMNVPFSLSENVIPFISNSEIPTYYLFFAMHNLIETTEYKRHWSELMSKKVLVPPTEVLTAFADNVKLHFSLIEQIKVKNRNLIKQRDLLLPRLMSGKLEVR